MKMRQQMRTMARLVLLLLLLWVGCQLSVSTELDLQKRVIGGQPCGATDRRYHVRLWAVDGNGDSSFCGGSLISERWILTAAHCLIPGWTIVAGVSVHPLPLQGPVEGTVREVRITDPPVIYSHGGQDHDIALLRLPATFQHNIQSVPLCNRQLNLGEPVQVAGHAATTRGVFYYGFYLRRPGFTPVLHCADTDIVGCQAYDNTQFRIDRQHEHWMCGQRPGVDISRGDSGGGVVNGGRIHGIIIGCNSLFTCFTPSIFLDICHPDYLQWIRQTIANRGISRLNCFNCGG